MHPHYKIPRRTQMLPARVHVNSQQPYLASCTHTTRYHDAHKCFQLAFTSIHSNHTLRHAPTLQDTTTHRNASSSRSRRFTVIIPCVMRPHYKIPHTHTHASSSRSHQFTVTIPCVMHPHYKIPHTHTHASSSRSLQFTVTIPCVMHPHYKISRRTEMLPARVHVNSQ